MSALRTLAAHPRTPPRDLKWVATRAEGCRDGVLHWHRVHYAARHMKIALVTTTDARDLRTRSGTPFFMAHALRRAGLQVELVGPLSQSWSLRRSTRAAAAKLAGRTYLRDREPRLLRALAAETARRLERIDYDVVLSPSTLPVALLNVQRPVVTWSDATFA